MSIRELDLGAQERQDGGSCHKGPQPLWGKSGFTGLAPPYDSPFLSRLKKPSPQQFLSKCCNGRVSGRAWGALAQ